MMKGMAARFWEKKADSREIAKSCGVNCWNQSTAMSQSREDGANQFELLRTDGRRSINQRDGADSDFFLYAKTGRPPKAWRRRNGSGRGLMAAEPVRFRLDIVRDWGIDGKARSFEDESAVQEKCIPAATVATSLREGGVSGSITHSRVIGIKWKFAGLASGVEMDAVSVPAAMTRPSSRPLLE